MVEDVIRYIGWWVLFGVIHSFLANHSVKSKIPINGRTYRIIYNIIQTLALLVVLLNVPSITDEYMDYSDLSLSRKIFLFIGLMISGIIGIFGLISWNLLGFLGLAKEEDPLITSGIYTFSRHPVYTSVLLFLLTSFIIAVNDATLSWFFGAGGYFVIGTIFEERNLRRYFHDYEQYQDNVGRFFPWRLNHYRYMKSNFSNS